MDLPACISARLSLICRAVSGSNDERGVVDTCAGLRFGRFLRLPPFFTARSAAGPCAAVLAEA